MFAPSEELVGDNDASTTTAFVYPDSTTTVGVKAGTYRAAGGDITLAAATGLGSSTNKYIIANLDDEEYQAVATAPTGADLATKRLLATLSYDGDGNFLSILRSHVGDIDDAGGGGGGELEETDFYVSKASDTTVDVTAGMVIRATLLIDGSGHILSLSHGRNVHSAASGIGSEANPYIYVHNYAAAAEAAASYQEAGFPVFRTIAKLNFTDGVISSIRRYHVGDIIALELSGEW